MSPAPGVAHLEYEAKNATGYTIKQKGPGDAEYAVVAENVSVLTYDAIGLKAGEHSHIVIGHNSRGDGPESEAKTVTIAVAQAA